MPLLAMFIVFNSDSFIANNTPPDAKRILYIFVFILTVAMPGLSTYILVRNKMVSHITLPARKDRNGPYMITIFYYLLLYYLLQKIPGIPSPMLSMVIGALLTLLLVLIINYRFRISAHAAGMAGLCGIYMALSATGVILPDMFVLLMLILATGVVGTARLSLQVHSPLEVYSGAVLGFLCEYLIIRAHLIF